MDSRAICGFKKIEEQVHVYFAGEEGAGGGMDEENAVEEVEGRDEEEIILASRRPGKKTFEGRDEADCD